MGVIVAVGVLAVATAGGLVWRRWDGGLRAARRDGGQPRLSSSQLGQPLGTRATFVQFSSAVCAPCRATRTLLAGIAAGTQGVAHIEVDVADRMDLVRLLDVRRSPTVFVLDAQGLVTARASGVPRRDDILAALAGESAGQPKPLNGTKLFNGAKPTDEVGSDSRRGHA